MKKRNSTFNRVFTALVFLFLYAPIVLLMYTPTTFMLSLTFYFFIGYAAIALLHDKLIHRIFIQYTPVQPQED